MTAQLTTAVTELPVRGGYRIAPTRSAARFRARGLFGIGVRGQIPIRSGSVEIADGQASVTAELDPAGITTGIRMRDKDLRSARFLDVARFPVLRFESEPAADLSAVRGWLTLHGDTIMTTVDIREVRRHATRVEVVAAARLDRFRFGITAGRGVVFRYVDVELNITLLASD